MTGSFIHFLIWQTEFRVADSNGTSGLSLKKVIPADPYLSVTPTKFLTQTTNALGLMWKKALVQIETDSNRRCAQRGRREGRNSCRGVGQAWKGVRCVFCDQNRTPEGLEGGFISVGGWSIYLHNKMHQMQAMKWQASVEHGWVTKRFFYSGRSCPIHYPCTKQKGAFMAEHNQRGVRQAG